MQEFKEWLEGEPLEELLDIFLSICVSAGLQCFISAICKLKESMELYPDSLFQDIFLKQCEELTQTSMTEADARHGYLELIMTQCTIVRMGLSFLAWEASVYFQTIVYFVDSG